MGWDMGYTSGVNVLHETPSHKYRRSIPFHDFSVCRYLFSCPINLLSSSPTSATTQHSTAPRSDFTMENASTRKRISEAEAILTTCTCMHSTVHYRAAGQ